MYKLAKRILDIVGASVGLIVASPIMLAAAVATWWSLGSPVLFRQKRPGLDEEPFELIKFRTMREPEPGEQLIASDEDRITRVGAFLRSTSIDELPTLFNVLRGEMSLVGPRPLLMRYLDRYSDEQARRHEVKPGITGLAQIEGRNQLEWEEKFELDVHYVDHRNMLMDLKILVLTLWQVVRREGISRDGHATTPEFKG